LERWDGDINLIGLTQDKDNLRALEKAVMNLGFIKCWLGVQLIYNWWLLK
jgi:hypothetical protein